MVKGYAFGELLHARYPQMQIVEVENVERGLQQVVEGQLYGFIGTLATVGYSIQRSFATQLKVAGKFDERWELGVATRNLTTGKSEVPDIATLQGNGEEILVVDDEVQQRDIAEKLLTHLGYRVACVESGEKAVEYVRVNQPNLVILDMIMEPGMNGRRTYEEISRIRPGQKAIVASGYSENEEVKKVQLLGAGVFMKKPYTLRQIALRVQEALLSS